MATPRELLPVLLETLDSQAKRVRKNRRYAEGDAPLPEMGRNLRASWVAFQKKARTNFGGLTCTSLAGRIVPKGVRVGDSQENPTAVAARRVWRDNRLDLVFSWATWNMLTTGLGFILVGRNMNGDLVITNEDPEQVAVLADPAQPWKPRAAIKVWRTNGSLEHARVWVDNRFQDFTRKISEHSSTLGLIDKTGWESQAGSVEYEGRVPIHILENDKGVAEFEPHIDVLDRINLGKLQRLVITAMQAFRQRGIKGDLPDDDGEGNNIDWAKVFENAPGALWELPEGIDVWESEQTDIRPLLDGEKADAREYAALTQTPVDVLVPDAQNQSAQGALNAKEGEIAKATKRIGLLRPAFEGVLLDALEIVGVEVTETIEVQFAPPAYVSHSEKAVAAKAAKEAGMSLRWISRHIWGLSADEISELESDLAMEQLQLMSAGVGGLDANITPDLSEGISASP